MTAAVAYVPDELGKLLLPEGADELLIVVPALAAYGDDCTVPEEEEARRNYDAELSGMLAFHCWFNNVDVCKAKFEPLPQRVKRQRRLHRCWRPLVCEAEH